MRGIQTRYGGCIFRSRLEARWAAFFDLLDWPWEYEPLDLAGYIPDFVLTFPHAPVLVEVKDEFDTDGLARAAARKIDASGWQHDALIVGASWKVRGDWDDSRVIGWHLEGGGRDSGWAEGFWHHCLKCKCVSFHHSTGWFYCRVNGCYDGDHYLGFWDIDFAQQWREAGNLVRWEPRR